MVLEQPSIQGCHALPHPLWYPSRRRAEALDIGGIVLLIARTPGGKADHRLLAVDLSNKGEQFEQAGRVSGSPTNIEHLARQSGHVGLGQEQRIHEIVDKENIAHLEAIAVERDWLCGSGRA